MNYNYFYTQRAENDLDEILDYLVNRLFNKKAALDFLSESEKEISLLCEFPESSPIIKNQFIDFFVIRKKTVKKFILYYYADNDEKTIYLLAIRHSLEGQEKIIKGL